MNIAVGVRAGVTTSLPALFSAEIVTRSFEYLKGDYYIAPLFMDKMAFDFYGALRLRTYDQSILEWVNDNGGIEVIGKKLVKRKKNEDLPVFIPPEQTIEGLLEAGHSLIQEQKMIMENYKLSK